MQMYPVMCFPNPFIHTLTSLVRSCPSLSTSSAQTRQLCLLTLQVRLKHQKEHCRWGLWPQLFLTRICSSKCSYSDELLFHRSRLISKVVVWSFKNFTISIYHSHLYVPGKFTFQLTALYWKIIIQYNNSQPFGGVYKILNDLYGRSLVFQNSSATMFVWFQFVHHI